MESRAGLRVYSALAVLVLAGVACGKGASGTSAGAGATAPRAPPLPGQASGQS